MVWCLGIGRVVEEKMSGWAWNLLVGKLLAGGEW